MLTHLIILLDDTSSSYCHYEVTKTARRLISMDHLRAGILFAMKENLNIQFVYPDYELPIEYQEVIESIDHTKIKPVSQAKGADVIVLDGWTDEPPNAATCIIRCSRAELAVHLSDVKCLLEKEKRLNVVLTDVETFKDDDIDDYAKLLDELTDDIADLNAKGKIVQLNMLTDRMLLTEMNNCDAGVKNVTLAPNGRFYLCPAFYYENAENDTGDLDFGLLVKNQQLLSLNHAPLCRQCDAYQCKRCIWQNYRLTLDSNTPSHQQCVMAHLERNASRQLLVKLKQRGVTLRDSHEIKEIDYLDPFNKFNRWKQERLWGK